MTDYWKFIEDRLHEESGLHYPLNTVKLILKPYVNGIFTQFYEQSLKFLSNSFLVTMTGKSLDLKGEEYGITREKNESDDKYRQRILNRVIIYLSVNFIKTQKTLVFTKRNVDDKIRTKMTSNNPYLNNEYAMIPPNIEISDFIENDIPYKGTYEVYIKGWK